MTVLTARKERNPKTKRQHRIGDPKRCFWGIPMDPEGQNPASVLASILIKKNKLHEELTAIEKQVYELETSYLQDSSHIGNVLKGYEGYLSSSKTATNVKRSRKFQTEDRLFSLSSVTSPAAEELRNGRDDGRSEFGPGRSKGGLTVNGIGKPKKGRPVGRDSKRARPPSDVDLDYEYDAQI